MKIQAPKGTKDIYFEDAKKWQYIETTAQTIFELANFQEIRTPIFEYTELFDRGVGESTDIVNKEMYSFIKEERNYSLRPENTAGVVRAYIQGGLHKLATPQKLWYKGPMFRYERPQSGRQRQFHQLGIEVFGIANSTADAEVILVALRFLKALKLTDLTLHINNIGCPQCRQDYKDKIKQSLANKLGELCEDCSKRYNNNPLRLLDCKNEKCQDIYSTEPVKSIIDSEFICNTCQSNYTNLIDILEFANVNFKYNKKLVRGLDYYNGTVFEITSDSLGSQNAICGGGRYDGLVELLGGNPTPAVGWAMGMERIISLLSYSKQESLDVYIVTDQPKQAIVLADILRGCKFKLDINFSNTKFGNQLEKANKLNAKFAVIIGSEEVSNNYYTVKNLSSGDQYKYSISDTIACLLENIHQA